MRVDCDIVVVGGGHAGCEAAHAAARLGRSVVLVTLRRDRIGWMSCNPAVGGMAKGHLVREIDALGGLMGRVTDETGIQFRTLNTRRGPAVQGSRAQVDRRRYAEAMQRRMAETPGLEVVEGMVEDLEVQGGRVRGVRLEGGGRLGAGAVILTTGTFLRGVAHVGEVRTACGREGDRPSVGLARALEAAGFELGRFKTGTTPRLVGKTIDFSRLEIQPGDRPPRPFSFWTDPTTFPHLPQRVCHLTATGEATHRIVRENLHRSPLFRGEIVGRGPRYCPSIEDKVVRFADKASHTVYLEPDGLDTDEVYPGGISTSLPEEVQRALLRTLPGLEDVEIARPGYAIEYDWVPPHQIRASLETRRVAGLYLAGQINGTSGYEEAAAQGLMAGINAARRLGGEAPVVLGRDQAYIGVLIDDLVTKGTDEPYRLFTSRAEHRLLLREDNADLRLTAVGAALGLIDETQLGQVEARRRRLERARARLEGTRRKGQRLAQWLRQPGVTLEAVAAADPDGPWAALDAADRRTLEVEVKYAGYVARAQRRLERQTAAAAVEIPESFCFRGRAGLSAEVVEKLERHRPRTLAQAGRIPGVTPAALEVLSVYLLRETRGGDEGCTAAPG